jgi:hypothetical protein
MIIGSVVDYLDLSENIENGKWGMWTNWTDLKIFKFKPQTLDNIQNR